jgi:flagellar biosynthetic protein FliR
MTLALVRVSGMVAFAPFFSSPALSIRSKAVFAGAVAFLLAPLVATLPGAGTSLGFAPLLGELAVGLVYGLVLALLNEMLLFAGQIAGLQLSYSLSMVRSFHAVPLGSFAFAPATTLGIVRAAGGIFLAAVELAAPVLAATLLVEVDVALLGKLSPQLPVMHLTVPMKTLTGFAVLIGSLALWPRFIEARFAGLLDLAERLIEAPGQLSKLGG